MFRIAMLQVLLTLLLTHASGLAAEARLNFALLVFNGEQRNAYHKQVKAFEKEYPSIKVTVQALESEQYKANIESWLSSKEHSDVMFWFGGERLNWYVSKGWVAPLDHLWARGDWYRRVTQSGQSAVNRNGRMYGLPIHYYHWGVYYKKSLFARLGLSEPKNWQEFLRVCRLLKRQGVTPIALGSSEVWPLGGWFDYLNLRINGLDFHQQLLSGGVAYTDERVATVFDHWGQLINKGFFLADHNEKTWRESLPYLYRDMAGMLLMGNFWTSQIPESFRDDFAVFRFPIINSEVGVYEEAPTDVLFMPSNVKNRAEAELFLDFMARPEVQNQLNTELGMLAPQNHLSSNKDHFIQLGAEILGTADGASQFYDRDNPQPIAIEGMKQMQRFMNEPTDLPSVLRSLEGLRRKSFN